MAGGGVLAVKSPQFSSKAFTGDAVALLVEQGSLDLDVPVQRYVPSFPEKPWPITTRQLAGHQSGIRHYRQDNRAEFYNTTHYPTVTSSLAMFAADPLEFEPGTRMGYSTYGYTLLAAVIEGAAGEEFLTFMTTRVFRPLGMLHTTADHVDSVMPDRATKYDRDRTTFRVYPANENVTRPRYSSVLIFRMPPANGDWSGGVNRSAYHPGAIPPIANRPWASAVTWPSIGPMVPSESPPASEYVMYSIFVPSTGSVVHVSSPVKV